MLRAPAILLGLILAAGAARAEYLLVPSEPVASPGSRIEVSLFIPNDSGKVRTVELPPRISLRARGVDNAPEIVLSPVDGDRPSTVKIAPGQFHRARYSGMLPDGLTGNLVLELVEFQGPPMALAVFDPDRDAAAQAVPETGDEPAPTHRQAVAEEASETSDRDTARFLSAFSPYEPNYFIAGSSGSTNAKFQISLKFRLFNPNTLSPLLEKFYLGYSQTSIWDIGADSAPFYDTSYRPTLFFLDEDVAQWPFRKSSRLGVQAGVEHESNGKDGPESRSMNTVYVRPTLTVPLWEDYFFAFSPKLYTYVEKSDNPDMPGYRGYGDYQFKFGTVDGLQLSATLRKGTYKDPYSAQFDLSYPLRVATFGNLGGYLLVQYFEGWGESLLDYDRHVRPQFRVGLMITR